MAARLTAYVVVAIVAATLIAGLMVGAQRDDNSGPVDLIVHNARVFTADARGTVAEAVAIRGNQILRVGSEREINRLRRPQTAVVDAKGGSVLPGFNDAHLDFIEGGLSLDGVNLLDAVSTEDVQQAIRLWAETNPDRSWVIGRGWSPGIFPDGLPTRQLLDALVSDRPALLVSADGRTYWANSRALRLARVTRKTPDPADGTIVREAHSGEPSGLLKGAAATLVSRLLPRPSTEDRGRALRAAIDEAHRNGVTSVQSASANPDELGIYAEAQRTGDLKVRVYSAVRIAGVPNERDLDRLDAITGRYPDDPLFKTGAAAIDLDGAVESHTAAMLEPYANRPTTGASMISADDLNRLARQLDARGWQIMTHAAGDRAVRMSLDAYEHAARSNPAAARGRRHRVEGIETVDPIDLPRFGALGVIASMEPFRGEATAGRIETWSRYVGTDRMSNAYPYKSLASPRGHLAFGTGWPAAPLNPLLAMHMAVNRTNIEGTPESGWNPDERLPLGAAIKAFTSGAAWASFDDQRKGTIAAGMLADLVVLSEDIFKAPSRSLTSASVAVTIFDGKIVFQATPRTTN